MIYLSAHPTAHHPQGGLTYKVAGIVEHTSHLLERAAPRLLVVLTPKERRRLGKLVRKFHRGLRGV